MSEKTNDVVRRLRSAQEVLQVTGNERCAEYVGEAITALESAERDAVRYRWLREKAKRSMMHSKKHAGEIQVIQWADRTEANVLSGDALDAAVDALAAPVREGEKG